MTSSEWLNQRKVLVVAGTIVVALSVGMWARSRMVANRPEMPTHRFFVDEISGEISEQPLDAIPPLPGKDGKPTVVRGVFYTFGSNAEKTLAYMEKYTDAGKAAFEKQRQLQASDSPDVDSSSNIPNPNDCLIREPEPGSPWVLATSAEGAAIMTRVNGLAASNPDAFRFVIPR